MAKGIRLAGAQREVVGWFLVVTGSLVPAPGEVGSQEAEMTLDTHLEQPPGGDSTEWYP